MAGISSTDHTSKIINFLHKSFRKAACITGNQSATIRPMLTELKTNFDK